MLDLTGNVIPLGESGGGKTGLTEWLGKREGYARCTARQLINGNSRHVRGNARVLVIDALDEVAARGDGDAVDLVLRALRDAGYPSFGPAKSSSWTTVGHKRASVREKIEAAGARLMFLPPYSHDFNPKKKAVSRLKAMLRNSASEPSAALDLIGRLVDILQTDEYANYFSSCGYDPD